MKQRITLKQLNELSEEGKERLMKWWKPKAGDLYIGGIERACYKADFDVVYPQSCYTHNEKYRKYLGELKGCIPLLSIGQMIELLEEKIVMIDPLNEIGLMPCEEAKPAAWGTTLVGAGKYVQKKELCDCLWDLIKHYIVLREEEVIDGEEKVRARIHRI